ncbi:hypothetical protein ACT3UJ_14435 [Halomonas sp. 86]|uniref:hypothetical protein n=1 Tax=unclassified Halomonas TaxID=2609666 RepID=UPI0040333745
MLRLMSFFEKKLPILTAATPGAFRIFVIVFTGFFVATESMAFFSTEYTLTAFFVMISGVGFSTILVKGMAERNDFEIFLSYALTSLMIGGGVSVLLLYLISFAVPVPDFSAVLLLVLATSIYQVFRSYLIFNKNFWGLLLNDVLVGFFYLSIVIFWYLLYGELSVFKAFVFLAFSYFFSLVVVSFVSLKYLNKEKVTFHKFSLVSKKNTESSLVVGFSNAASGGVSFILPSFFIVLGGEEIAIVASLAALVFNAIAAIPRGIINNSTAALSRMVLNCHFDPILVSELRKKIKIIIVFLFPCLSLLMLAYLVFFADVSALFAAVLFIVSLGFYIATAQFGVVESVLINLCGYENFALVFNAGIFMLIWAAFLLIINVATFREYQYIVYSVPVLLGVVNIIRMFWYRGLVNRYFKVNQ